MLKGFKEFILRGNVVELATAVIIGGAFTAIVTAFTSSIIEPLFAAIPTGDCDGAAAPAAEAAEGTVAGPIQSCPLGFKIISDNEATFMDFGALLTAIINFLIIAAVVYFLIIMLIVAGPQAPFSDLRGLIEQARREQDGIAYAAAGAGTYHHIDTSAGTLTLSTLGPFFHTDGTDGADPPTIPALQAAGFRHIDPKLAGTTVDGLHVYFFGNRDPLTVGQLLFYWQD